MEDSPPSRAPLPDWRRPAWTLSILLHAAALLLLVYAVDRMPRGAAEEPGRFAGIVLKRTSIEGDLYEGEAELAAANDAAAEQPSPDQLLAVLPSDTQATEPGTALAQAPAAGPGSADQPGASQAAAGGGGRGSGDYGQTQTGVFGVQGTGNKFVYVFDRSWSMNGAPLAAAKRQLIESINSLRSTHQFQIIFFNQRQQVFDITGGGRRIAFATDRNKQLAANFIGGITADDGTDRLDALLAAIALQPDVIFFLTDADDPMLPNELAKVFERNRGNATICTVEFGSGPLSHGDNFLTQLARQTGGQYGYVDTTELPR